MDRFDDLPNIKENIENKLKKKQIIKSEKEALSKIDSLNLCEETINKTIDNITNNNNNLNESIKNKGNEISKNLENLLKKLEEDTNNHIAFIEKSNLTEEEKKDEYIKCLEELDKISLLSQALENCIEISEENFLKFLEKPLDLNRDNLIEFLIKEEENLKKNNVYDGLKDNKEYLEELYNNANIPYLKNYISQSSLLTEENIKLINLKVNENSDIGNIKELLITLNNRNEIMQDKINKISLKNISKENLNYIFSKNMKNIKKTLPQPPSNKNVNKGQANIEIKTYKSPEQVTNEDSNEDNYIKITYKYPNIKCENCDCSEIKVNEIFPDLQKLKLASCQLPFLFITIDDAQYYQNITELYLENCNIIDENFKEIYYGILNNKRMGEKLIILSFKNNKISVVSVYNYIMEGERKKFRFDTLEFLDLSNNNINHFNLNLFDGLPNLKVIDFSNNNIQLKHKMEELYSVEKTRAKIKDQREKEKIGRTRSMAARNTMLEMIQGETPEPTKTKESQIELLFLIAGNIVLNREEELEKYFKFLIKTIPMIDFPLKNFNFSGLFYKKNFHHYLYEINLLKYRNSLVELDLSLCNLTDVEISKLLMKEFLLKNLKKINLSNNNLTDDLFKLLIENNSHEIYDKLKEINLSNNQIYLNRTKELIKFVQLFDCVQKILIYDTPAEEIINNYIKKKIIRFNEEQNNKKISTEFNKDELIIKALLENNGKNSEDIFGNQSKIKIYLNNNIDYKFIEASKKLYPELFDKAQIKCSNNYFN